MSSGPVSVGSVLADHLSLYGDLTEDDRDALGRIRGVVKSLPRGEDVFKRGDRPSQVVIVVSGMLQRYSVAADGRRQVHSFYIRSDTPSLETLYIDYVDHNLGAVIDSQIGLIPHQQIYRIIDERPEIRKLLWRETLVQASIFREWLMRNSTMPAHASVAHFFCEMFLRARAAGLLDGDTFTLPITQETLSDAVGLTAVHVNRTLMLLRDAGVIEWRSGIARVTDWEKLVQIGEFEDHYLHLARR